MSDVSHGTRSDEGAFRFRTVAILLAIGVLGFIGTLVLGAYAPDLGSGRNGGAHALSNAAVGYSGLIQLAEATGRNPLVVRDEHRLDTNNLLVLTPESGKIDLSKAIAQRDNRPTLVVLPKWMTEGDPEHSGWVRYLGILPHSEPEGVLAPGTKLSVVTHRSGGRPLESVPDLGDAVRFHAPRPLQVISGSIPRVEQTEYGSRSIGTLTPLITDGAGGIVLARVDNRPFYILSDPDLLSNMGMKDQAQAGSALAMLDWLGRATPDVEERDEPDGISFDVTLNGLGQSPNPFKLAFEPPLLAATLAVAAALALAGWHAFGRFGAPVPRERAIAFGKAALVDNTAALVRKAGRQARIGGRYAALVRDRARVAFGLSVRERSIDAALDRLPGRRRFTDLAAAVESAERPEDLLAAARALHAWRERGAPPTRTRNPH